MAAHPDRGTSNRTRLVTRLRQRYQLTSALPVTVALMELADFPMMRQMLRGIRSRAENKGWER